MAEHNNGINSVMESLLRGANALMSTKTVVGEPTKIDDTIIVPLVDVSFGVGAGATRSEKKDGGGGGLSGKMTPSAVLLIRGGQTRLVNIKNQDSVTKLIDMIPDIVDRFTAKPEPMMSDEEAQKAAFPSEEDAKSR